ncbi:MAG: archaeal proteasome endopeptidase complex subunit alpha [Candidatus Anstonellales archaeon]
MYPSPQAYDRAITVFSPDGRLFQVEYAREAVKRGSPSIGAVCKDGIVMIAAKKIENNLIVKDSIKKIDIIHNHLFIATAGLVADAKKVLDYIRDLSLGYRNAFNEDVSPIYVVKQISNLFQSYTQYGGVRPFGISVLVAGMQESDPILYEIDPSGAYASYYAVVIGNKKKEIESVLNQKYDYKLSLNKLESLLYDTLTSNSDKEEYNYVEILSYNIKGNKLSYELKSLK